MRNLLVLVVVFGGAMALAEQGHPYENTQVKISATSVNSRGVRTITAHSAKYSFTLACDSGNDETCSAPLLDSNYRMSYHLPKIYDCDEYGLIPRNLKSGPDLVVCVQNVHP